jgi:hypothetical protein
VPLWRPCGWRRRLYLRQDLTDRMRRDGRAPALRHRSAGHGIVAHAVCSFGSLMITNTPHQRGAPKHFSIPFARIESLQSALRFRVPLRGSAHELEVLR